MLSAAFPQIVFSSIYHTAPQELVAQPMFWNAVATMESGNDPHAIAHTLHEIERSLGRKRDTRYGPRTIDLDLLLYGDTILPDTEAWHHIAQGETSIPTLVLPHPKMHLRRFVLQPIIDMGYGSMVHPIWQRPLSSYLDAVRDQKCMRQKR